MSVQFKIFASLVKITCHFDFGSEENRLSGLNSEFHQLAVSPSVSSNKMMDVFRQMCKFVDV